MAEGGVDEAEAKMLQVYILVATEHVGALIGAKGATIRG
jgi:predicted RNA-binding protein YlqC (UPF0109 family)